MQRNAKWYWMIVVWLLAPVALAAGNLFNVVATGTSANVSLTLCLNGAGPASCQNYSVAAADLSITTTVANHTYPAAGIKINTSGYNVSGCTPSSNGYCLFSVSNTAAQSLVLHSSQAETTLSVGGVTNIIPVNADIGHLVVTNTGSEIAYNVSARLPSEWLGVSQNSSDCSSLAPGGSCSLHFTASRPYVAASNILITGDNIESPPTVAFAFSINDYLVFAVPSDSTALVVADSDASTSDGLVWSTSDDVIPGITETSTSPPSACNGATDGACNSEQIVSYYHTVPTNEYAAGLCYSISNDSSGSVPQGTWFLPAICQLNSNASSGGPDSHSGCNVSTASIYTNLYSLGFLSELSSGGSIDSVGNYWTSTECSGSSDAGCVSTSSHAWAQNFGGDNNSFTASKNFPLGVRCVRVIPY